jgi:hypothetical protein
MHERSLLALLEDAMQHGVAAMRPELERLFAAAEKSASIEEKRYLPHVAKRIEQGSLAEIMVQKLKETNGRIEPMLERMQWCLKENRPYSAQPGGCGLVQYSAKSHLPGHVHGFWHDFLDSAFSMLRHRPDFNLATVFAHSCTLNQLHIK